MTDPGFSGPAPATAPSPWRHRFRVALALIIIIPIASFAFFTWSALHWSYSKGERSGILQTFSEKGWLCKTWEGELAMTTVPGTAPIFWDFTVRNDSVAAVVSELLGHEGRMVLTYEEHRGVPTRCFGDTPYYVVGVRMVK
ncbi:MAG TPA: hypothetical protein VFI39_00185 [Gemmatimonadales bacterium]|nr:hypothetical protein [Gemmatimonadales bacterium]